MNKPKGELRIGMVLNQLFGLEKKENDFQREKRSKAKPISVLKPKDPIFISYLLLNLKDHIFIFIYQKNITKS